MCKVIDRPETEADTFPEIPEAIKHKQRVQVCVFVHTMCICVSTST